MNDKNNKPCMTNVHPANSPYNVLSSSELENWIREWHQQGCITKKDIKFKIVDKKDDPPLPAPTPAPIPAPTPARVRVRHQRPARLKEKSRFENMSRRASKEQVIDYLDIQMKDILTEISDKIPELSDAPINWIELRLGSVKMIPPSKGTAKKYAITIYGAAPNCTELIIYLKSIIKISNIEIITLWKPEE